jgi:predicted transcriptional regulator
MAKTTPLDFDFRLRLKPLGHAGLQELARISGVPFTTLWKIYTGESGNPRIETVKQFAPHINAAQKAVA